MTMCVCCKSRPAVVHEEDSGRDVCLICHEQDKPSSTDPWQTKAGLRIVARLRDLRYVDMIPSNENVRALAGVIASIIIDEQPPETR